MHTTVCLYYVSYTYVFNWVSVKDPAIPLHYLGTNLPTFWNNFHYDDVVHSEHAIAM
jgi:hypothetical protein